MYVATHSHGVHPKTDYFRHLGAADCQNLIDRVIRLPESTWHSENQAKPNKFGALAQASHIVFRFITDFNNVYDYQDRDLWQSWSADILPIMQRAAQALGYTRYAFPRVMLARLPAGAKIHPHVDANASYYIHKIHVPLVTNADTHFLVGNRSLVMPVGNIIEVNNKRKHAVINKGDSQRIHLIFECYNQDDYRK